MTPAEKRKQTILKRYGSYKNMLARRDVRELILGGYNGGTRRVDKGFSKWDKDELQEFVASRERDANGRFLPKTPTHTKGTSRKANR